MAENPGIDIGISDDQRKTIADGLGRMLADTYVLYGKTHGFHWNVTGPMFNTLHLMFMEHYTELWNALDEIAERIPVPLGFQLRSEAAPSPPWPRSQKRSSIHRLWTWSGNSWQATKQWHARPAASLPSPMPQTISPVLIC